MNRLLKKRVLKYLYEAKYISILETKEVGKFVYLGSMMEGKIQNKIHERTGKA
jgi:hypothetical protein